MKLLWLDLETTGLDPDTGLVLEVAMVLTTGDLTPLAEYSAVVHHPTEALARIPVSDYVQEMHDRNGLWNEVRRGQPPSRVVVNMDTWARTNRVYKYLSGKPTYLAGASVHFDRRFLRRFAPDFEAQLHHRHLDISTMRVAVEAWGPRTAFPHNSEHRAMGDVLDSIRQARVVKGLLSQ